MGLRPRFKTPFSQARDKLLAYAIRPLMFFQPRTRFLIGCALLVTLTTGLLITDYTSGFSATYKEGEVLTHDIVAPADITAVDEAETERRKEAAREATRPVFNYDASRAETSVQTLRADWDELQKQIAPEKNDRSEADLERLASIVREIGAAKIYDDNDAGRLQKDILLIDRRNKATQFIVPAPRTSMDSLSSARQKLEWRIRDLPGWTLQQKNALTAALSPLIRPNVFLEETATATDRENAANDVKPVVITLKRNQVVAREGDTVTPSVLSQIDAIKSNSNPGRRWPNLLGLLIVVIAVYWAAWKFAEHRRGAALTISKERAFS